MAYGELASMFPDRSGAEVVYLEQVSSAGNHHWSPSDMAQQAYPRPRFFVPIAFAVTSVLLSFVVSKILSVEQCIDRTH